MKYGLELLVLKQSGWICLKQYNKNIPSYFWATYLHFHATSSICLHTIALYMSVTMALIRWRVMSQPFSKVVVQPILSWYFIICRILSKNFEETKNAN